MAVLITAAFEVEPRNALDERRGARGAGHAGDDVLVVDEPEGGVPELAVVVLWCCVVGGLVFCV